MGLVEANLCKFTFMYIDSNRSACCDHSTIKIILLIEDMAESSSFKLVHVGCAWMWLFATHMCVPCTRNIPDVCHQYPLMEALFQYIL